MKGPLNHFTLKICVVTIETLYAVRLMIGAGNASALTEGIFEHFIFFRGQSG